jgi:hypothetical protein
MEGIGDTRKQCREGDDEDERIRARDPREDAEPEGEEREADAAPLERL